MEYKAFKSLNKLGLRVLDGISTRGKDRVVAFEAPVKINDGNMLLLRNIRIGKYSYTRTGTLRHVKSIGRYCAIGPNVTIGEGEHPTDWLSCTSMQYHADVFAFHPETKAKGNDHVVPRTGENYKGPGELCAIGNDVWIGAGAQIRRGVKIGDGAIIAGGAFVGKDVEPYSIVGGLPAKVIRKRFDDPTIERLLKVKWWRFDIHDLAGVDFSNIHMALDAIEEREASGAIKEVPTKYRKVLISDHGWREVDTPAS